MYIKLTKKQEDELFGDFTERFGTAKEFEKYIIKLIKDFSKWEYADFTAMKRLVDKGYLQMPE